MVAYIRFLPKLNSLAIPLFTTSSSNKLFIPETDNLLVIKHFHEFTNEDFTVESNIPSDWSTTRYSVGECTPIVFVLDEKVTILSGSLSVQAFNIFYSDRSSDVVLSTVRSILRRAQANRELSASGLSEFAAKLQGSVDAAQSGEFGEINFSKIGTELASVTEEARDTLLAKIIPLLNRAIGQIFQAINTDQMLSLLSGIKSLHIWDLEELRQLLYQFMLELIAKEKFLEWSTYRLTNFKLFKDFLPDGLLAYHEKQPHAGQNALSKGIDALHHLLDGNISVGKAQCYFYLSGIIFGTRYLPPQLNAYVGGVSASLVNMPSCERFQAVVTRTKHSLPGFRRNLQHYAYYARQLPGPLSLTTTSVFRHQPSGSYLH